MGGWLYYVKGSLSSFGLAGSDAFVFVKSGSPKAWRTMTDVSPYLDEYQKRKISETGELGNFLKYLMSLNEPFEEVDEPITFDEIHTNPTPKQPGKHWKVVTSVSELQPGCRLKISYNQGTEIDWSKYSENATRTMSLKDIKTSNLSLIYNTRDLSDTLDMFSDKDGFVAGYEDDPFSNESCCYMYLEEGYDGLMFGNEYGD